MEVNIEAYESFADVDALRVSEKGSETPPRRRLGLFAHSPGVFTGARMIAS